MQVSLDTATEQFGGSDEGDARDGDAIQRGGPPTNFDRVLATQFGAHAVRLVLEEKFGQMVSYEPPTIKSVLIRDAVNRIARVCPNSSAVVAARALGVSFGQFPPGQSPLMRSLTESAPRQFEPGADVAVADGIDS